MHLLRLRPTAEQLRSWNGDVAEPIKTIENIGYTAWLRELTPLSTLELEREVPSEQPDQKLAQRIKTLEELFDVAEKEESFANGECGSC